MSHFNVSLFVRDKVTRQCPHTLSFEENEKGEPKRAGTDVRLLQVKRLTTKPNWPKLSSCFVVVAFSSLARISGEGSTIHSWPAFSFFLSGD